MTEGPQCHDERKIPAAACDRAIPATECLAWHVHGQIPGSKLSNDNRACRFRCPNHDDRKASAVILVGDNAALTVYCHACGEDAKLEVRAAVIRAFAIDPKHLPLSRQERVRQEAMLESVFISPYTPCTRLVCVRAILDGIRGPLPPAPPLVRLGERAGVSRAQAFRARRDLGGVSLDHLFVPKLSESVKDPKVTTAFRVPPPISDGDPVSNGDRAQSPFETGTKPAA